jgi:hypothetical protein
MDDKQVRDLIKGWYVRARREDATSKFVFLWFCFNAWLAHESEVDTDTAMIHWLKRTPDSRLGRSFRTATGSSVFAGYLQALTKLSPILSTGRRYKEVTISSPNDFPALVQGIYQVRCNLFHGGKRANDVRDQKLVKVCALILEKWVGNLLADLSKTV